MFFPVFLFVNLYEPTRYGSKKEKGEMILTSERPSSCLTVDNYPLSKIRELGYHHPAEIPPDPQGLCFGLRNSQMMADGVGRVCQSPLWW